MSFEDKWKPVLTGFNQLTIEEVEHLIAHHVQKVGHLVKLQPVINPDAFDDQGIMNLIPNLKFRFGDESNAVLQFSLHFNLTQKYEVKKFFSKVNKFLKIEDLDRQIESCDNGDKLFIFTRAQPYGKAIVKYSNGCLSLCSFEEMPLKSKP